MAARTTTATGNVSNSDGSVLNGGTPLGTGDTLTANHVITFSDNTTFGVNGSTSFTINAACDVAAGKSLTIKGNVIQADAGFTLNAGSGLIFDTTSGNVKWLFGDVSTYATYANCTLFANGTSGSHCSISKIGSNYCWFDEFSENSGGGSDKIGYDFTYMDATGIGTSDGGWSFPFNSFGPKKWKFNHCTWTSCGEVLKCRPFGGSIIDCYMRNCTFTSSTGGYAIEVLGDGTSDVNCEIRECFFDKVIFTNALIRWYDNFFEGDYITGGNMLALYGNTFHGVGTVSLYCNSSENYYIYGLGGGGNPHFTGPSGAGVTHTDWTFEYPIISMIDGGEAFYNPTNAITLERILILPSETDGEASSNVLNSSGTGGIGATTSIMHCTVVGKHQPILFDESSNDLIKAAVIKSNLSVSLTDSTCSIVYDLYAVLNTNTNQSDPTQTTHNGMYGHLQYADPTTGHTYDGYRARYTSDPGANDIVGQNPNFVDPTRNFANWAVYKGAANIGDSLAVRTAASVALLKANPILGRTDMQPWVRAGFAPQNIVYKDAGHDGITIGAIAFFEAPTPPDDDTGHGDTPPPVYTTIVPNNIRRGSAVAYMPGPTHSLHADTNSRELGSYNITNLDNRFDDPTYYKA